MNRKKFENKYISQKLDETKFIVGIDIGNATSSIAYYDINRNAPELIDVSGGYGKANVPTVAQYIRDTKEWIFGEYAVLNKSVGDEITFDEIVENLGKKIYYDIDGKPISNSYILSLYIRELMENIKNLNPNAELIGLVVSTPCYMTDEAKKEMYSAFVMLGLEKKLIAMPSDRECIIHNYCFSENFQDEKILLLDFGSRETRAGIYTVKRFEEEVFAECNSSLFDSETGIKNIDKNIYEFFEQCYKEQAQKKEVSDYEISQLEAFSYRHKDLIFQNKSGKNIKLYYNFAYPPFQKTVTEEDIFNITSVYQEKLKKFLIELFDKNISDGKKLKFSDINKVLCLGGGFEMLWARNLIFDMFGDKVKICKNPKGEVARGACVLAASVLGVCKKNKVVILDKHQLTYDIGIMIKENDEQERFFPIIERNSFWWQNFAKKRFIVDEAVDKPVKIEFFKRNTEGETEFIDFIELSLPKRPKKTTSIAIELNYTAFDRLRAVVEDCGFGELFPKTDYRQTFDITL